MMGLGLWVVWSSPVFFIPFSMEWNLGSPLTGGWDRYHIITQLARTISGIYKWYILPIGRLYGTCHLLRELETTIDLFCQVTLYEFGHRRASWHLDFLNHFFGSLGISTKRRFLFLQHFFGGKLMPQRHRKNKRKAPGSSKKAWNDNFTIPLPSMYGIYLPLKKNN